MTFVDPDANTSGGNSHTRQCSLLGPSQCPNSSVVLFLFCSVVLFFCHSVILLFCSSVECNDFTCVAKLIPCNGPARLDPSKYDARPNSPYPGNINQCNIWLNYGKQPKNNYYSFPQKMLQRKQTKAQNETKAISVRTRRELLGTRHRRGTQSCLILFYFIVGF